MEFTDEILKIVNEKERKGMGGSSYSVDYRPKGNSFFMTFRLSIYPRGLRVMMNEMFLSVRIQGGRFDDFDNHITYGINGVFSERFTREIRKNFLEFGFIVKGIHNHYSVTFMEF